MHILTNLWAVPLYMEVESSSSLPMNTEKSFRICLTPFSYLYYHLLVFDFHATGLYKVVVCVQWKGKSKMGELKFI